MAQLVEERSEGYISKSPSNQYIVVMVLSGANRTILNIKGCELIVNACMKFPGFFYYYYYLFIYFTSIARIARIAS